MARKIIRILIVTALIILVGVMTAVPAQAFEHAAAPR